MPRNYNAVKAVLFSTLRRLKRDAEWETIGYSSMFGRSYVQKVLCSEGPLFRRSFVQKVLCSEGSIFRRFYVQKVLCLESTGDYFSVPVGHTTLDQRQ